MEKIIEMSHIKEPDKELSALEMVREVLKDYEILHNNMLDGINASLETGDVVTEQILTDFLSYLEKRNWMFTSYLK